MSTPRSRGSVPHPLTGRRAAGCPARAVTGWAVLALLARLFTPGPAAAWESELVTTGPDGRLVYGVDAEGLRVPEFSHAGYRSGGVPLPDVPTVQVLSPAAGDDTARIQAALDAVGALPPDPRGLRGALRLAAGEYELSDTLVIDRDGVVLRGDGDGEDPAVDTILRRTGTATSDVIRIGGGSDDNWRDELPGTRTDIVSPLVPLGARSFEVADASAFACGDRIVVFHPCTQEWLDSVDGGATAADAPWNVGSEPLAFMRHVASVDGNTITLDAPLFNPLDRSVSQSYAYRHDDSEFVRQVGIESLRVVIETAGPVSEDHARSAVAFVQVEDAWARDVTTLHFLLSGFILQTATRVTVRDCRALEPHSEISGGRRYNFNAAKAQLVLFESCEASEGRHAFVGNGTSFDSGVVFLDGLSTGALTSSEAHRRWGMGFLYDGQREVARQANRVLALYNRGDFGTGHGWSAANSVAWNCDADGGQVVIQKPPTAQNYAIGCRGRVDGDGPFAHPTGYIEGTGRAGLEPPSLYRAQLAERTAIDLRVDRAGLSWTQPQGYKYDVVHGDLLALHGNGLELSALGCLADDTPVSELPDGDVPATPGSQWFLVRRVIPGGGHGSYGWDGNSRDAAIAASGRDCGY